MKKTPLHSRHLKLGAKMGEFAEYDMPLYYPEGVIREHEWVRTHAGLFDVSHMGQVEIEGPDVAGLLEKLTPSSFQNLPEGRAKYTVMTNEEGGIVDDLIISRAGPDKFFAVINAGCKDKDIDWIRDHLPEGHVFCFHMDFALLALQGPSSESVLREVLGIDASDMPYMSIREENGMLVSRLGYTGEDGFELSIPEEKAGDVWDALLAHDEVKPIGLAARDSLRLEMGYPLYGHDIDAKTSPVEADLSWVIGKNNAGFIGAERVLREKREGPARVRIGLKLTDKGIAREGADIRNLSDVKIGELTSGSYAPSLGEAVGMGYVDPCYAAEGTQILVNVRGRNIPAVACNLPFLKPKTKSAKL